MLSTKSLQRFDYADLARILVGVFKPRFELPPDDWAAVDLMCRMCPHRFPVDLAQSLIFEWRVNVIPAIYRPKPRNPLTEMLLCNPGRTVLVRDPSFDGTAGVFMAVADVDELMLDAWARRSRPCRMILGEQRGVRMMAAPVNSFIADAKKDLV